MKIKNTKSRENSKRNLRTFKEKTYSKRKFTPQKCKCFLSPEEVHYANWSPKSIINTNMINLKVIEEIQNLKIESDNQSLYYLSEIDSDSE